MCLFVCLFVCLFWQWRWTFIACKEGFYNQNCLHACSSNCKTRKPTDKACNCLAGWMGSNCSIGTCTFINLIQKVYVSLNQAFFPNIVLFYSIKCINYAQISHQKKTDEVFTYHSFCYSNYYSFDDVTFTTLLITKDDIRLYKNMICNDYDFPTFSALIVMLLCGCTKINVRQGISKHNICKTSRLKIFSGFTPYRHCSEIAVICWANVGIFFGSYVDQTLTNNDRFTSFCLTTKCNCQRLVRC